MSQLQVHVETLSPVVRRLDIQVPPERVAQATESLYERLGRSVRLKGFRPGHVPRRVLEKHFAQQVRGDVARELVDRTFPEALATSQLEPVGSPVVEPSEVQPGETYRYSARVEVRPEVTLAQYAGVEVAFEEQTVSDADVQKRLEQLREGAATTVAVEDRDDVRAGDLVAIDYEMAFPGTGRAPSQRTDALVRADAGLFVEGHGEKLVGAKVGETRSFTETFPTNDEAPAELAGKEVSVTATVKGLKQRDLPELSDDFAKEVGRGETLAELSAEVRTELEAQAAEANKSGRREALLGRLLELNPFEVPASLVDSAAEQQAERFLSMFARSGMKDNVKASLVERIKQDALPKARLDVQSYFLLEAVAKAENISAGEADIEAKILEIAAEQGAAVDAVRQAYRPARSRAALVVSIQHDMAYALVESKAVFTAKK